MQALFGGIVDEIQVVNFKFVKRLLGQFVEKGVFADTGDLCKVVGMELLLEEALEGVD